MNPAHIAQIALERWRNDRTQTLEGLAGWVEMYATSYHGNQRSGEIAKLVEMAHAEARSKVRAWELTA
jgi:hypothetical protein